MSTQKSIPKEAGSVGNNPVRLDTEKAEQIIEALSTGLANAYVLYRQFYKHHWNVEDAEHLCIHESLQEVYEEVEEVADETAERLRSIGGAPRASMPALSEAVTVESEDEDVYYVRTSLSNDLEVYGDIIENYREHIELATSLEDRTTTHMLREQLIEIEEHAYVIDHYLEDDMLVQ